MKKHILLFSAAILFVLNTFAQSSSFETAMAKNLELMRSGKTAEELQQAANGFERIAAAEQKEWLPLYYAALTYINISSKESDENKKDQYLDKGQEHLNKALKLVPKESELHVLQGYLHLARINVAPMARGMKYSGMATEAFEMAKSLNPANPRVYYMLANTKYNTPKMFGGGPEAARPYLEQAKEKYEAFKPATAIAPNWGEKQVLSMLEQYR
ncbi:tetratricopeptide (TPR) repeat protein [Pontibacter aydingkolensis]|uniref:Tetratricopeptide repeat-containing protein n=1 Tax=Pontibacter aydingkolensis TaxID=1911536 RepID=A0ABS7CQN7_9BACT|nr:hypothetical protein [Pontibacter aydingkolensis]MBW7466108.1 hypothetical protein [Pontibacter aydingkolensis]